LKLNIVRKFKYCTGDRTDSQIQINVLVPYNM